MQTNKGAAEGPGDMASFSSSGIGLVEAILALRKIRSTTCVSCLGADETGKERLVITLRHLHRVGQDF